MDVAFGREVTNAVRAITPRSAPGMITSQFGGGVSQRPIASHRPKRSPFSGVVFLDGVMFANCNSQPSKPYVMIDKVNHTVNQSAGPIPDPVPYGQEWYRKAYTYGDIHETGF